MLTTSVILAAGRGTRMKSDLPKVLHPICGKPMILYAVETAEAVTGCKPVLVVGHGADQVEAVVGERALYVHQSEQKGTAHALRQAESLLRGRTDTVLVTTGDMPLFKTQTLLDLAAMLDGGGGPLALLTVFADDPRGFGRIVRSAAGDVLAIVEEAVATPEQLSIRELNVGAYAFADAWLWDALASIRPAPKGEYYLTDIVEIAVRSGLQVRAITVTDPAEAIGINTPEHLAEASSILAGQPAAI